MRNRIYDMCFDILNSYGKTKPFTVLRACVAYEDEQVDILGVLDREGDHFDSMRIALKFGEGDSIDVSALGAGKGNQQFIPFHLTRSDSLEPMDSAEQNKNYTLVYYWRKAPLFYRPGVWVIRLQNLIHAIDGKRDYTKKMNGKPVDDDAFFPEIESNDPRRQQL